MGLFTDKKKVDGVEAKNRKLRYSTESMKQAYLSQKDKVVEKQKAMLLKELERLPKSDSPSINYFHGMADIYGPRLKELLEFKAKGGKVVGQLCVLAPAEPIYAAGAVPVRICSGEAECAQRAQDLVGDAGLCPLVKAIIGGALSQSSPYIAMSDLVVGPTPCDAKLKAGEILDDMVPVISMNMPRVKTEKARETWLDEVKRMVAAVEKVAGRQITAKSLRDAVLKYQKAQAAWRRFSEIRKKGNVIWGRDMLLIAELTFIDDIVRWTENLERLNDELEQRVKDGKFVAPADAPRILIGGSPIVWPNWKVPHLIEDLGALIVDDELCTATRALINPTVVEEATFGTMLESVADRYLFPCTCPCFTPNNDRETNLLRKIKDYKVDGIVFHVLKGCHLNSIDATRIKTLMKEQGVPLLVLDSDYGEGDVGQLKIRVEAFLEMLRARKEDDDLGDLL
jgi:benzoyl-CoA reductase/2-hydroxyglutaryl-CoA dehydratase subunit BcrC/BadD/HgdB